MKLADITRILNIDASYPDLDIQGIEIDSRTLNPGSLFVALKGDHFDGHHFIQEAQAKKAACLLVSQPVSTSLPVIQVQDTLEALSQLAAGYRQMFSIPVVGLTGSCGKTTTKTLIAQIFEQSAPTLSTQGTLNNHIGVPLTLLRLRALHEYAVIEMGANHPGEIAHLTQMVRPTTALITNIAPVHLEGFKSLEGVFHAKSEIFQGLAHSGLVVLNADEPYLSRWRGLNENRPMIEYGLKNKAPISAEKLQLDENSRAGFWLVTPKGRIPIQLKLTGHHHVMNALAAAACAYAQDISLEQIKAGLEALTEIDRRMCHHKTLQGAHIIDDTYNANPVSTLAALDVLKQAAARKIFVLGDMLELGENAASYHKEMGVAAKEFGVERVYTYGNLAKSAIEPFKESGFHFTEKKELINALKKNLDAETTVLIKGSKGMKMWEVVEGLLSE